MMRSFLLVLGLLALSCGGNGDNPPDPCIEFTPGSGSASGNVTSRVAGGSTCDVIGVDLYVTDVDDVFAADFTVAYDTTVVSFVGFSATGSFLASDGAQVETLVNSSQPGRVVVGMTRLGVTTGIDVVGSRLLARVTFRRETDAGSGFLTYSSEALFDSQTPPQEIPGVQWFGGTFVVN